MIGKKTLGAKLRVLLGMGDMDDVFLERLEDTLIEGDLGPAVAMEVVDALKSRAGRSGLRGEDEFVDEVRAILSDYVKIMPLVPDPERLNVYLVLGVNGVGKTTTIAKMADFFRRKHGIERILLCAGDTFRAAAINQLKIHGERLKLGVVGQSPGADPGAVVFDTLTRAQARGMQIVLVDTAGRMHTKTDLVRELEKVDRVIRGKLGDGVYRKVLVIDATTGQNALHQAEIFHEAIKIDSIVLAKYDSTAKGGIAVSIGRQLGLPFSFMGVGEKMEDLTPFDLDEYLDSLVS